MFHINTKVIIFLMDTASPRCRVVLVQRASTEDAWAVNVLQSCKLHIDFIRKINQFCVR